MWFQLLVAVVSFVGSSAPITAEAGVFPQIGDDHGDLHPRQD